jgi:hypothetical protein
LAAPDPLVGPDVTRFDRRWRLTATQNVPITEQLGVYLELQRDVISSTLPNFAYSNISIVMGPRLNF